MFPALSQHLVFLFPNFQHPSLLGVSTDALEASDERLPPRFNLVSSFERVRLRLAVAPYIELHDRTDIEVHSLSESAADPLGAAPACLDEQWM